ncbi:MAG: 3-oxoacyl-ACP synthase, partial [Hyphomicrobiaceae bacterium]|nr:3-oxoacyl-ACP synthase [Hyphomicrobiaceae bacterium]
MIRTRIVGTGSYLPERTVTNEDLEKIVDTSDEWIVQRTGIRERHYAAEGERTSDLGIAAARRALEASGHDIADIDLILVATST